MFFDTSERSERKGGGWGTVAMAINKTVPAVDESDARRAKIHKISLESPEAVF
jgi:hypothetical protein